MMKIQLETGETVAILRVNLPLKRENANPALIKQVSDCTIKVLSVPEARRSQSKRRLCRDHSATSDSPNRMRVPS